MAVQQTIQAGQPPLGKYEVIEDYRYVECVRYAGSTGIVNPCIKEAITEVKSGDVIQITELRLKPVGGWEGKFATNKWVPLSELQKIPDSIPEKTNGVQKPNAVQKTIPIFVIIATIGVLIVLRRNKII